MDMKSKVALLSLVSFLFTFAASAQGIENDDMYFNSKDRAKLVAAKASEASYSASIKKTKKEKESEAEVPVNPTDSYSARNVNPEYEARSNSQTAQADDEDYFVNNYRYNTASNFNNFNNNFNRWYNNPWYGGNFYDPYINSWNTPYYGSYYDVWGNPWRNPYYRSGWSSSFSYHWGSSWNYGWGMNFGWGNYGFGNPYNAWGWDPYYGSYYGWGSRYNYYPSTIIIVNNENGGRGVVYGKRATSSRTSVSGDNIVNTGSRTRSTATVNPTTSGGNENVGGRVSTSTNRRQEEYYNRSWRSTNSQNSSPSRSTSRSNDNTNSNWNNGNANRNSSYENTQRSRSYDSPAPSRSYDSGGGSRSSSGSTGSSSSGGSRGRTRP
jgi:hypothetical protein